MPFMEPPGSSIAVRTILLRPKQAVASTASKLFPTQDRIHSGNAAPIILRQLYQGDCIVNKPFVYGLSLDGHSATLQGAIVEYRGFKYELELD